MAQTTEAACLLQSGAMYPRRIGLQGASAEPIFAGVKPGGVSVYFGDAPIYHFDLDGRWQRAFVTGTHYLKGLDATVRSVDRERDAGSMVLRRGTLPFAEAADLDASIRSVALGLIDDLDSGRLDVLPAPSKAQTFAPEEFRDFLERVTAWDSAAWFAHRERYLATYGPIPFLPPDCPNALILQATLGHLDGRAFGGGRPAEHYVRSPAEFLDHAQAVDRLTGKRIAQHRGVFLGGADLLHRPLEEVLSGLETIGRVFPVGIEHLATADRWDDSPRKLGAVHAFLDDFGPSLPDLEGWRILRAVHLGQVTLGIESGDPAIRATFGKCWRDEDLRDTVVNLKAAGIGIGLVALVGAGGRRVEDHHVEGTAALLASLPLGRGDLVSLVDARNFDPSPIEAEEPLSDEESTAQVATLKRQLADGAVSGPKVVAYNPLKRWS